MEKIKKIKNKNKKQTLRDQKQWQENSICFALWWGKLQAKTTPKLSFDTDVKCYINSMRTTGYYEHTHACVRAHTHTHTYACMQFVTGVAKSSVSKGIQ